MWKRASEVKDRTAKTGDSKIEAQKKGGNGGLGCVMLKHPLCRTKANEDEDGNEGRGTRSRRGTARRCRLIHGQTGTFSV